jgi:deoxyribose-phosphate aldolase
MKSIKDYLDSTYLKTPQQSGLTEEQTRETVHKLTRSYRSSAFCSNDPT